MITLIAEYAVRRSRPDVLRVVHVSDTHGEFPPLPDGDIVVHSGDLLPDCWSIGRDAKRYQTNWMARKREAFARWLDGRLMLVCRGNHDLVPIRIPGAVDITNHHAKAGGIVFRGFPWIASCGGGFAFETRTHEMDRLVVDLDLDGVDVLVAHAPPFGVLDLCGSERFGIPQMPAKLAAGPRPRAYLCGHVHESPGVAELDGMIVSNAARTARVVTLETPA